MAEPPRPDGAVPTAELARRRAAGEAVPRTRGTLGRAVRRGAPIALRTDVYAWLMGAGWGRLLGSLGAGFLVVNLVFAGLYLLQPGAVEGMREEGFFDAFSFSVQTLGTIGYGVMHPGTRYGDAVVFVESVVGTLGVALATGLMFAKASRPSTRVLWSDVLTLTTWNGRPTLQFRVGNATGDEIVEATMTVAALMDEVTLEGHHLRRMQDLKLVRSRSQLFTMTWLVQHVIDDESPLRHVDWRHPDEVLGLIATLVGHDATYGQTTHARRTWDADAVRVGARFVDVTSQLPDGRLLIDYTRFHDTVPDAAPPPTPT